MKAADIRKETLLITGFGPFPGMPANVSSNFATSLARRARRELPGMTIICRILPTEWRRAPASVARLHERYRPDISLHFGVAAATDRLRLESQASNRCLRAVDAAGEWPASDDLCPGGAAFERSTLAVDEVAARLSGLGYEAEVSHDAGGYICNAVFFRSLTEADPTRCKVGFIHVPSRLGATRRQRRAAMDAAMEIVRCAGAPCRRT